MNKAILIGNLGRDPETRMVGTNPVCSFSLATTKKWIDASGERKEKTEWHNVVIWGKLASVADKYLSKGSKVCIEGEINYRSWEDNGVTKYKTEINVSNMEMLDSKGNERTQVTEKVVQQPDYNEQTAGDDDPPF